MSDPHEAELSRVTFDDQNGLPIFEEYRIGEYELAPFDFVTGCDQLLHEPEEVSRYPFI